MPDPIETKTLEVKFQSGKTGIVKGLAATFGGEPDAGGDVISPGAFTASLTRMRDRNVTLKMLFNHDRNKPIGKWSKITETAEGLAVEGKLTLDADAGADAYALMKDGVLDALSIGYAVTNSEPRQGGGRSLTAIELVEISVVTFPMNERALVTDVKGITDDPETKAQKAASEKGADMPLDKTASELDAELQKAMDRISDLEAKAANINAAPAVANTNRAPEVKAFHAYVRKGELAMDAEEVKALNSGTDAQGGFLVPEDFRAELIKTVTEESPMRQVARTTNTGRDELILPKRVTKLAGGWTFELADRTESEPTYGHIKIPVHELGVFTAISNQNLEDSAFDMQSELTSDFGEAFGEIESEAFILGDGIGKPTGILSNADIPVTNSAAPAVVDADDLISTFYAVKASYRNAGAWMMNSSTLAAVRKLKTANGDFIWRESLADGQPATILGRPVIEAVHMPDPVTNAKAIIFGDFRRAYRIVSRLDLAVLRDPYSLASKSMVRFHARARVGGDTVQPEAARMLQLA